MYIRIQNQTIRYRVSLEEAKKLIEGYSVGDYLALSNIDQLSYLISVTNDQSSFTYSPETNLMALQINREKLLEELKDRPSKQGILIDNLATDDCEISVFLEVDIKKSRKI